MGISSIGGYNYQPYATALQSGPTDTAAAQAQQQVQAGQQQPPKEPPPPTPAGGQVTADRGGKLNIVV